METAPESPNDAYPPSTGHWVNAVIWVLISLATLFLGLRVFCKFKRHRGLWWDDWVLIASWLVLISSGVIMSLCVSIVFIDHNQDNQMGAHDVGFLSTIAGTLFFVAAIWSKTSFALTLIRIASRRLKIALRIIIVSMNMVTCISVILRWLQCHPTRMIWDPSANGTCWDRELILGVTIFASAYSAFLDFVLAALPWPIIIKLQIRTSEKIGISIAMSMGVCAGITAIVKSTKFSVLETDDFANKVFELAIWSIAEIATTIMAASIPVLRALVHEAAGTHGRFSHRLRYIKDRSREVASRVRSNHVSVSASGRSKTAKPFGDITSDDKVILNDSSPSGHILKLEEINVQFADREIANSIDLESERMPQSYSSTWI
ncbi:hypothetical protein GGS26DRAFT_449001 [Hypomontagnella submonticulosa]|nr:hypothetical protein GGS26DRAFT_449001 [Hypomontagnella submonticulosa]